MEVIRTFFNNAESWVILLMFVVIAVIFIFIGAGLSSWINSLESESDDTYDTDDEDKAFNKKIVNMYDSLAKEAEVKFNDSTTSFKEKAEILNWYQNNYPDSDDYRD